MLVDGGAARNDLLLQRQADFAALRVVRPGEVEATARGAAAMAAVGAGLLDAAGLSRVLAAESRMFEPDANGVGVERARWRDAIARVRSGPSSDGPRVEVARSRAPRGAPAAEERPGAAWMPRRWPLRAPAR